MTNIEQSTSCTVNHPQGAPCNICNPVNLSRGIAGEGSVKSLVAKWMSVAHGLRALGDDKAAEATDECAAELANALIERAAIAALTQPKGISEELLTKWRAGLAEAALEWAIDAADCSGHINHKAYAFALRDILEVTKQGLEPTAMNIEAVVGTIVVRDKKRSSVDVDARHLDLPPGIYQLVATTNSSEISSKLAKSPQPAQADTTAVITKHRRHVELSPGVGEDSQKYALAVIDDIIADLPTPAAHRVDG